MILFCIQMEALKFMKNESLAKNLNDIIHTFFSSRDTGTVLDHILEIACNALDMDRAYLYERKDNNLIRTHLYYPTMPDYNEAVTIPMESFDWNDVTNSGIIRFIEDRTTEGEDPNRPSDVLSYIEFPIIIDNEIVGMGGFACKDKRIWNYEDHRVINDVAGVVNGMVIRNLLEKRLIVSNSSLKSILDSIDDVVYVVDYNTNEMLYANRKLRDTYNMDLEEIIGKTCWETMRPDLNGRCFFCHHHLLSDENKTVRHELYNTLRDKWFDITDTLIEWEDGRKAVVMVCLDITKLKQQEELSKKMLEELKLQTKSNTFALTIANGFSWRYLINEKVIMFSPEIENVIGYSPGIIASVQDYLGIVSKDEEESLHAKLKNYVQEKPSEIEFEHRIITKHNGERIFVARGRFFDDEKNIIYGATFDVTESKQYENRLHELAYKDTLTGLHNLHHLVNIATIDVSPSFKNVGAVLLDISRFKRINDTFGHSLADQILAGVGKRLSDYNFGDIKARISADHFLIVKENTSKEELLDYIKAIEKRAGNAVVGNNQRIKINLNYGILITKEIDLLKIIHDAELALRLAKTSSKHNYYILDGEQSKRDEKRFINEFSLQRALDEHQLFVVYQPVISINNNTVDGAEALVRWNHPEFGVISPGDFISLAEETGLINPIGDFVILEVIKQLREWLDSGIDKQISLNLSPKQFLAPNFKDNIIGLVHKYNIPAESLIVEVTESIMISDFENITETLIELHDNGILIALDDFGTGYSSMQYLGVLPIDILKIDRIFIHNAARSETYLNILKSIIAMAHSLNMDIVAEGVETQEEISLVRELQCEYIQGFYYSKPLEINKFKEYLSKFAYRQKV